jgi:hypothetical protein
LKKEKFNITKKWSSYLHNYYAHLHPCTSPINPLASELMLKWVEMCFMYAKHMISWFDFRKFLILQILATAQNHHSNVSFQCMQFNIQHHTHTHTHTQRKGEKRKNKRVDTV